MPVLWAPTQSPWTAGYLSSSGSNVDVSAGADPDLMSFYSTTSSTTWKDPGPRHEFRKHNYVAVDTSTGFIKNFGNIEETPDDAAEDKFVTTYRAVNNAREGHLRVKDSTSRTLQTDCQHTGGFATASSPSPIKWRDEKYRRMGFPSKVLLDKRRKKDPTEWENDGVGPSDFSTSFGMSWTAPDQQVDKCNARSSLNTGNASALERANLTSGWRENVTNRDHPWVHPGAPTAVETTYRLTNRVPLSRGAKSDISSMPSSGYARSARKIVFGRNMLQPDEKVSTTHLNYLTGRNSPAAPGMVSGTVVELNPVSAPGTIGFAPSGFSKNASHPMDVFPRSSEQEVPPATLYATSTGTSFSHPSKFLDPRNKTSVVDGAAGLPSSYGRAVIPVNRLYSAMAPTLNQLHPSVAQLRARRDPLYYDSKTFKITMDTKPWGVPEKIHSSAPFMG